MSYSHLSKMVLAGRLCPRRTRRRLEPYIAQGIMGSEPQISWSVATPLPPTTLGLLKIKCRRRHILPVSNPFRLRIAAWALGAESQDADISFYDQRQTA